ncbi:MAG: terminase small subunit [Verrucomicrobia bacterium]|nr:terminase small subunit [Verrucomicrobiota bacterium]
MPPPKKIKSGLKKLPSPTGSKKLSAIKLRCLEFIEHYLQTFNATEAARQMGYKGNSASSQGYEFFHHPFTKAEFSKRYEQLSLENKDAHKEIISMIWREANFFGEGSTHSARVRAQSLLSKIFGLETIQIKADVEHRSGVMLVPVDNRPMDEIEKDLIARQRELKRLSQED